MTTPTFQAFGLAEPIQRALASQGFTAPTPIQAAAIPLALEGKDVLGIAQTGTGKTAAFVLPALQAVAKYRAEQGHSPLKPRLAKSALCLILAPTRELASQIHEAVIELGKPLKVSTALVVGGAKAYPQIKAMMPGVDILVATPGRLEDHLQSRHIRLDATRMAVLDEADQMMDLGFMPAIRRLLALLPKSRQTMLLSATMPKEIRQLAEQFLNSPVEVSVAPQSKPIESIRQELILVNPGDKPTTLVELLGDPLIEQAIVFTRTKHGADRVQKLIRDAGHFTMALHGNKTQGQRDRALDAFRNGRVKVLVATDIAARGIDVDTITHVFNYDLPNIPEAYVHRIGRTGRAGRDGVAVSLCEPSEQKLARQIERLTGCNLLPEHLRQSRPPRSPGNGYKGRPGARPQGKPRQGRPHHDARSPR